MFLCIDTIRSLSETAENYKHRHAGFSASCGVRSLLVELSGIYHKPENLGPY